jgi:hypothetical protein
MEDRPYLTPAELDFRRDPSVTALGGDRYVVATDPPDDAPEASERASAATGRRDARDDGPAREPTADGGAVVADADATDGSPANESLTDGPRTDYFADIAVRTDEGEFDARFEGDDIGAVFASMLRWYARRVSPDDDPKKVLSVLLSRSEFAL